MNDVNLFSQGSWANNMILLVGSYDAGSDSGLTFASSDQATQPQELLHRITTPPLATNGIVPSMGFMIFERIDGVNECSDRDLTFHDFPIQANTYTTNESILATGVVFQNSQVVFQAGTEILCERGFTVQPGGVLELVIAACN